MWGENPGLQVGDMASSSSKPYDGKNLKKLNTLASGDLSWINKKEFKPVDLFPYTYPSSKDFNKSKIKILYLGWFFEDWSMLDNAQASILYGLKIRKKNLKIMVIYLGSVPQMKIGSLLINLSNIISLDLDVLQNI